MKPTVVPNKQGHGEAEKTVLTEKDCYELADLVSQGSYHHGEVLRYRDEIARRLRLKVDAEGYPDIDDLDEIENSFDFNDPIKGFDELLRRLKIKRAQPLKAVGNRA